MGKDGPFTPPYFPAYSSWVLLTTAILGYVIYTSDIQLQTDETQFAKFLFALRWQAVSASILVFAVFRVGKTRFVTGAINPLTPGNQDKVDSCARQLQNTLEQFLMNAVGQIILSTYLEPQNLRVIPGLVLLFVTGRILFFMGYPNERGPGYTINFSSNIGLCLANLYFLVISGPLFRL